MFGLFSKNILKVASIFWLSAFLSILLFIYKQEWYSMVNLSMEHARAHSNGKNFNNALQTGPAYSSSINGLNQRIYISDKTHSIPLRLPNMCLTQPLPALSVVYIEYTTPTTWQSDRAGGEVGWDTCLEDSGGCCVFYHLYIIYSLV